MLVESSPSGKFPTAFWEVLPYRSLNETWLPLSPQRLLLLMDLSPFLTVLRQTLRQKHLEAQQSCRPHNLPVLQAAQQRELEVGVGTR